MITWRNSYQPPNTQHWTGRVDLNALPERFHQQVHCIDLRQPLPSFNKPLIALVGFCCDEGIRRNQGRVGARQGPLALRQALSSLAYHRYDRILLDVGDIVAVDGQLPKAQQALADMVHFLLSQHIFPIVIGGGHETAWGHFQGLAQSGHSEVAICNIDAHFDLRDIPEDGISTSGTSFWQIAQYCQQYQIPFDYTCYGIQRYANTTQLFMRSDELQVHYVYADSIHSGIPFMEEFSLQRLLKDKTPIYLTICLDAFNLSVAPGVSAPQVAGLWPHQVLPLIRHLLNTKRVVSLDVVELSPPYDQQQSTAKLAALLVAECIQYC